MRGTTFMSGPKLSSCSSFVGQVIRYFSVYFSGSMKIYTLVLN